LDVLKEIMDIMWASESVSE